MPGITSQIPVGTQFSPKLIRLPAFLQALIEHSGDKSALIKTIWSPPVNIRKSTAIPDSTRNQSLPLEAAIQYDLIDNEYQATDYAITSLSFQKKIYTKSLPVTFCCLSVD